MAKRFTETNKWDKVWFRKLSTTHKVFWGYILDRCSSAGVWEVDFETAEYYIRGSLNIDEIRAAFDGHFVDINGGSLWFIPDFIDFQYGELSESCNPHKPVINQLKKLNLLEGYMKGFETLMDKDKDKDKGKDKRGIAKGDWFGELFWPAWPNKKSQGKARQAWIKINPDEQLLAKILAKIEQAKTSVEWRPDNGSGKSFIPKPSTWLDDKGWEDEYRQPPGESLRPSDSKPVEKPVRTEAGTNHISKILSDAGDKAFGKKRKKA
jgi:hypothetical protein